MKKIHVIILIVVLAALGIYLRLSPHPANFAPIGAIALFAGVYLPKKWAIILPLGIMLLTDLFLGFYEWQTMLTVYGCLALTFWVGVKIKNHKNFLTVASATMATSIIFFMATNFAVWAFSDWYPHNATGLVLNYYLAIPFFRNSLLSDLFFTGFLFGSFEMARYLAVSIRQKSKFMV
ncbi:MAG: DUF6580 family putative transport protein [Patescibacteria group bacterium]|jgi:hypothetical protein